MAASSSKPTAVHFFLVFFIILSILLGVLYYVEHGTAVNEAAKAAKATKDKIDNEKLLQAEMTNTETLKKVILGGTNTNPADVGVIEADNPDTTVIGQIKKDHFPKFALGAGEVSYKRLVDFAAQEVKTRDEALAKAKIEKDVQEKAYKDLETKYSNLLAAEKGQRESSESQLRDVTKNKDEVVASLNKDKEELQKAYSERDTEFTNAKLTFEKEKKSYDQRISRLTSLNQKLIERIELIERVSFEVPTGLVRHVDTQNKLVYINLGEADRLPKRTTFSVYSKSHSGIARGSEDIKGAIEVTRIIDAHTAECRITKENIYDPIAKDDPIYTPLWFPGQPQRFAFIGMIDMDNDGQDDRIELHDAMKNAQAIIDAEVLDNGDIQGAGITPENPTGITERTKFFVLGKMPELATTNDQAEIQKINKINDNFKKMQDAAREHGVRIITMTDFLNYIGYKSSRRLFKPGQDSPYTLINGASSRGTNQTQGHRESAGQTSGAYDPSKKNLKPPTSNGIQSKLFKGGR